MNKKGIVVGLLKIMIAVVVIILALALAGPGKQISDIARNATNNSALDPNNNLVTNAGLDCVLMNGSTNTTINDFQQATCIATDLLNPLYMLVIIALAGVIIAARIILK